MNKIETLIKELCPDGVEWKELNDVILSLNTGLNPRKFFKLNTPDANNYYITIKEIRNRQIKILENTDLINDEALRLCNNRSNLEVGDILFSGTGTIGQMVVIEEEPFNWNIKEGVYSIKPDCTKLNSHFLMYLLESEKIKQTYIKLKAGGTVQSIPMKALRGLKIPIPPLEIQEEIVKILDKFTDYVTELTTELTLRQKQYNYYRDKLLLLDKKEVELVKLSKICKIYDGTHQTPKYTNEGVPFVSVENIKNLYSTLKHISNDDYKKFKIKPKINDIFMTRIGDVGTCTVVDRDEDLAYYVSLALIRPDTDYINPYYLKYYIESTLGRRELNKRILHTAVPIKINMGDIGKIMIPLPSLEIQNRVVKVLDNFETIINDISNGLPKEIELRQKQYEYYRDKLLSVD